MDKDERNIEAASEEQKPEAPSWLFENIVVVSQNARSIYLLYLGFLAYCALTVVGTSDRQLILNEGTNLPIIGLDVPFNTFIIVAPLLLIFVFCYFQLYLQRLIGLRADLRENYAPTKTRRLYPWMINIAEDPEPGTIGKLQQLVVQVTLWWLLPLILTLCAYWFLKKHVPVWSYVMGLAPICGVAIILYFWHQYEDRGHWFRGSWARIFMLVVAILFEGYFLFSLIPRSLVGEGISVDLSNQILINEQKPEYEVPWLDLEGVHLEGANFSGAVLRNANLSHASLQWANLFDADLQEANLEVADLQGADLVSANLQGSDLRGANLQGADLRIADLQGVDLRGADLQGADLRIADLRGAVLDDGSRLCKAMTLLNAKLDVGLLEELGKQCPQVLEPLSPES